MTTDTHAPEAPSRPPPGAHGAAVTQLVGELVPIAELLLPMVRKQLASEFEKNLASIDARTRTDVPKAVSVHGVVLGPEQAERTRAIAEASGAWARAEIRELISALESGRPMSVAAFVDQLLASLLPAMQAGTSRGPRTEHAPALPNDDQLAMMIRGDTAFRLLVAFLEHTQKVLRGFFPRSMIDVRSNRKSSPPSGS